MKIFIGTDHNGFHLKNKLYTYLLKAGYDIEDEGDAKLDPDDDFPIFAARVVQKVHSSKDTDARGVLICGSGQGMCIAANRFKGIRAALIYDRQSARSSRNDDDSNVACIPADAIDDSKAYELLDIWLNTAFAAAPRFKRRIRELDELG